MRSRPKHGPWDARRRRRTQVEARREALGIGAFITVKGEMVEKEGVSFNLAVVVAIWRRMQ